MSDVQNNEAEKIFTVVKDIKLEEIDKITTNCEEKENFAFDSNEMHQKQLNDCSSENKIPEATDHLYDVNEVKNEPYHSNLCENTDISLYVANLENKNADIKTELYVDEQNKVLEDLSHVSQADECCTINKIKLEINEETSNFKKESTEKLNVFNESVFDPIICKVESEAINDNINEIKVPESNDQLRKNLWMIYNIQCDHKKMKNLCKRSGKLCEVKNCGSSFRKGFKMFQLNKNRMYYKTWLKNCEIFSNKSKTILICERHFESQYFGKRLAKHAIPTLNLNTNETDANETKTKHAIPTLNLYTNETNANETKKELRCYQNKNNTKDLSYIAQDDEEYFTINKTKLEENIIIASAMKLSENFVYNPIECKEIAGISKDKITEAKNQLFENFVHNPIECKEIGGMSEDKIAEANNQLFEKTEVNIKPYQCNWCGNAFMSYKRLSYHATKNHLNTHNKIISQRVPRRKCAVKFCLSKFQNGAKMYKFSRKFRYYQKWIENCELSTYKTNYICKLHFESHYFGKRGLKTCAIPTIKLNINRKFCSSPLDSSNNLFNEINTLENTNTSSHIKKNSNYSDSDTDNDSDVSVYIVYDKESDHKEVIRENESVSD